MGHDVKYDFAAADRLSHQLTQLAAKLEWLVWLRNGERRSRLAGPHSDNWKGVLRNKFEHDFGREQAALTHLANAARSAKARVDSATAEAHAAQKNDD